MKKNEENYYNFLTYTEAYQTVEELNFTIESYTVSLSRTDPLRDSIVVKIAKKFFFWLLQGLCPIMEVCKH